jgi:hypothetical protein
MPFSLWDIRDLAEATTKLLNELIQLRNENAQLKNKEVDLRIQVNGLERKLNEQGPELMDDYPTEITLCDGKYTVVYDFNTGRSECLRYGEQWRDLVGDKMVLAMFDEIVELRKRLNSQTGL